MFHMFNLSNPKPGHITGPWPHSASRGRKRGTADLDRLTDNNNNNNNNSNNNDNNNNDNNNIVSVLPGS